MDLRSIPTEFDERRQAWFRLHLRLRRVHNWVGTIGILSSVVSVAGSGRLGDLSNTIAGAVSLLAISLLLFYVPLDRAKVYIRAWRVLDEACLRYATGPRQRQR